MKPASLLDRFAFGPVAAVRPWLLLKATLLLLALDVWHTHLGPAWRYGAAGFNVAHFAWMNGLPIPTRDAYVAMLVGVGVASIVCALMARPPRALLVLITFLYTWGWSCSMHDSYQHHYLISLMLFGFCFFPRLDAKQIFGEIGAPTRADDEARGSKKKAPVAAKTSKRADARSAAVAAPSTAPLKTVTRSARDGRAPAASTSGDERITKLRGGVPRHGLVPRVHSVGYAMVMVLAAVVYTFTAISKSELEWRDGDALRNITRNGAGIPEALELAHAVGMSDDTLFWLMGHSVILVQIVCALGYLFATSRDGESTPGERTTLREQLDALHVDRVRITLALTVTPIACALAAPIVGPLAALVLLVVACGVSLPRAFHRFLFAPLGRPSPHAILAAVALFNALSFHVGAEYIGLQIGWFSYYMIVLALIAFAPPHWLSALAMALTAPFRHGGASIWTRHAITGPVLGIAAAIAAVTAGESVDLPGAYQCSVLVGIASFVVGLSTMLRPDLAGDRARGIAAVIVAMGVLALSVGTSDERYDYYRFAGGDFRRRHQYVDALEAYRAADRYAPEGESRASQIEQMEALIESGAP